jgi:hypothetical protein
MNISPNINNSYWQEPVTGWNERAVRNPESNDWAASENELFSQSLLETGLNREQVLNQKELATLHMLFGTQKPEEMTVYGKNKMQQIHKGHLIDLVG